MSQKRPFWPFWPVISEAGWTSRKKVPLGIRLKSARRSHMRVFLHVTPHRGENQKLRRGCELGGGQLPLKSEEGKKIVMDCWREHGTSLFGRGLARGGQVPSEIRRRTKPGTRGAPGGCYGPLVKQTNHKRHLVSACFALGSCAGCSNMPVRSLMRTRRRRRATGRGTKRGICQARRWPVAPRARAAGSPTAATQRTEDRAPFASLSDLFEEQHRKARRCSQQAT